MCTAFYEGVVPRNKAGLNVVKGWTISFLQEGETHPPPKKKILQIYRRRKGRREQNVLQTTERM